MNIEKQIKNFINDNFLYANNGEKLKNDQSFLKSGIIDSTGVLELISFVEDTFKIKIEDDELIPENLDSINNVNQFILRKKKEQLVSNQF